MPEGPKEDSRITLSEEELGCRKNEIANPLARSAAIFEEQTVRHIGPRVSRTVNSLGSPGGCLDPETRLGRNHRNPRRSKRLTDLPI